MQVAAVLFGSAVLSGLVAGAVAGVALLPFAGSRSTMFVAAIVVGGVVLDIVGLVAGRPAPPAIGRQVPREWIEFFSPITVAALFGARLGIGPATILSTWTWWSVTVAAGLLGLGPAVAVGATFAAVRIAVMIASSFVIESRNAGDVMPRLRAGQRTSWAMLNFAGLAAAVVVLAVGCSGSTDPSAAGNPPPVTTPASLEDVVRQQTLNNHRSRPDAIAPEASSRGAGSTRADPPAGVDRGEDARLESSVVDALATDGASIGNDDTMVVDNGDGSDESVSDGGREPVSLADDLPVAVDGFDVLDVPGTDRFLTLLDAAELQPDPSEEVALLETRGYLGGWTRAFRSDANDVAVASVYEFADPVEAEFYLEDGLITIGGYGGTFFDIDGLSGVRGFAQSFDDGDEELLSLGAAFHSGPRWYLVYLVGNPETVTPEVLVPIVAAQRGANEG
ncbi:MAG: hypothetical protein ACR2QO_22165 [Acidimicrobiales bacterium]